MPHPKTIPAGRLAELLKQINSGRADQALPALDRLLSQQPGHPGALALKAEALRLTGRLPEAIEAFKRAGEAGGGARNWLVAGALLAAERNTDQALGCLHSALAEAPENEEVLDALVTTLFNGNRQREGIDYARRLLNVSVRPPLLAHAALLLQSNDLYEESSNAFKSIIQLAPDDPAIIGAALVPARFTCDWEWIEALQQKISGYYDAGQFGAPQEYPLTHLTWCSDEARNLGVTRAYVERMVPKADAPVPRPAAVPGGRVRVGYLSSDFRNHATMHLMAGLLESHDRGRFEIFAYDYSSFDISEYRQRFLNAVEHHVPIHSLSDRQAALRIAEDRLDILFDLKLYTGGGRPGILAFRPAALQVAYLGFPGSAASPDIDYIVSDRFVTPDSSTPHYPEKFCRLPHSYQCNDRKRHRPPPPPGRALHGLPDDKVVFGAFNQSYKIDRGSFDVWMRILQAIPDSVLWLLGQTESSIAHLSRHAQRAGVDTGRLIFAPFAEPREHMARLQLADAVLDTLVCNGHTTTSDALWAGVPVITCRGRHFCSRVSESLLQAIELPELVGADADDMVRIAQRIGLDASYRAALRSKVADNRLSAPLFDTWRYTRNFETAIAMMVEAQRSGVTAHIDVPDAGPVQAPAQPAAEAALAGVDASPFLIVYPACPLCAGASVTLGFADCRGQPRWHPPLPPMIEWMRCPTCGHVHSHHHWTAAGLAEVQRGAAPETAAPSAAGHDAQRAIWSPMVERVARLLGGYPAISARDSRPIWVDLRCGDGSLVMTAADCGFAAVGLGASAPAASRIQSLGFNAMQHEFLQLRIEVVPNVLSLINVLERAVSPKDLLSKAAQVLPEGGVIVLSMPDMSCSTWKALDADKLNPYWTELEYHHQFSRDRIVALLAEFGFNLADFALCTRQAAQMELYAVRRP